MEPHVNHRLDRLDRDFWRILEMKIDIFSVHKHKYNIPVYNQKQKKCFQPIREMSSSRSGKSKRARLDAQIVQFLLQHTCQMQFNHEILLFQSFQTRAPSPTSLKVLQGKVKHRRLSSQDHLKDTMHLLQGIFLTDDAMH